MWFRQITNPKITGIIFSVNSEGLKQIHIGTGEGHNEKHDELMIVQYGRPLTTPLLQTMLNFLAKDGTNDEKNTTPNERNDPKNL